MPDVGWTPTAPHWSLKDTAAAPSRRYCASAIRLLVKGVFSRAIPISGWARNEHTSRTHRSPRASSIATNDHSRQQPIRTPSPTPRPRSPGRRRAACGEEKRRERRHFEMTEKTNKTSVAAEEETTLKY